MNRPKRRSARPTHLKAKRRRRQITPAATAAVPLVDLGDGVVCEPLTVRMDQAVKLTNLGETFLQQRINDGTLLSKKWGRTRLILYRSLKQLTAQA